MATSVPDDFSAMNNNKGSFPIRLGNSFLKSQQYHIYEYTQASSSVIENGGTLSKEADDEAPVLTTGSDTYTLSEAKAPTDGECVLIWDSQDQCFVLERISSIEKLELKRDAPSISKEGQNAKLLSSINTQVAPSGTSTGSASAMTPTTRARSSLHNLAAGNTASALGKISGKGLPHVSGSGGKGRGKGSFPRGASSGSGSSTSGKSVSETVSSSSSTSASSKDEKGSTKSPSPSRGPFSSSSSPVSDNMMEDVTPEVLDLASKANQGSQQGRMGGKSIAMFKSRQGTKDDGHGPRKEWPMQSSSEPSDDEDSSDSSDSSDTDMEPVWPGKKSDEESNNGEWPVYSSA